MFSNANLLGTIAAVISKTPTLKVLIYDGEAKDVKAGALETIKAANGGVQVFTFDEFLQLGKDNPVEANPATPEETACIMYTSGSTGAPKGVQISNANIVACGEPRSLVRRFETEANESFRYSRCRSGFASSRRPGWRDLHRLLASRAHHGVLRRDVLPLRRCTSEPTFFSQCPCSRANLALSRVNSATEPSSTPSQLPLSLSTQADLFHRTLTDASVRNCLGDIRTLKPTIMVGVPAVWELIRKGIMTKVKASGGLKQSIFNGAIAAKKFGGRGSVLAAVTDAVIFNAVKQGTGGRLKYALSGGAPIR